MVLLTNKDIVTHDANLTFAGAVVGSWVLYGFDAGNAVHMISSGGVSGTTLTLPSLPAMSANMLVIQGGDTIFANGFE